MSLNDKLLKAAAVDSGITPSEHFGVMTYTGNDESGHSINGGKYGGAAYFNGSNSRIDITRPFPNQKAYSVSFWLLAENNPTSSMRVFDSSENDWSGMFQFIHASDGKGYFYVGNGSSSESGQITTVSITDGTWKHIVCVYDPDGGSTSGKTYINGSLDSSFNAAAASPNDGNSSMTIGCMNRTSGTKDKFFEGKLDQVRFFTKAISSSEVSTLYAETAATVESLDPLSEDTTDTLQVLGDTSCLALYKFENNEDDKSGNYNATGTEIQYAAGRYGQAASFNGSASKIDIGTLSTTFQNNFSFSLWFNLNTIASSSIATLFTTFEDYYCYAFIRDSDKKVEVRVENASTGYAIKSTSTFGTYGVWHHLAVTKSSSSGLKIYINGSLENTDSSATVDLKTMNGDNLIGAYNSQGTTQYYLDGEIDQVRIFNKALSASEVTTLYEENALVASYRFEGNSSDDRRNFNGTDSNVTYEFGLNFTPDFVWVKERTSTSNNYVTDSSRTLGQVIVTDSNIAEGAASGGISSLDTGGFTTGSHAGHNENGQDYVAWCLKANGGTTSSNSDGSITSTVQANTDAGFSIVKYTGNNTGSNQTIGHGLGTTPEIVILKALDRAADWAVIAPNAGVGPGDFLQLNGTGAASGSGTIFGYPSNTGVSPTSTVFTVGGSNDSNATGEEYIAYCFANVDSFSKIGSYIGTGGSGNLVETGFEPAFIIIKSTSSSTGWLIFDNKRNPVNPRNNRIEANNNQAEQTGSTSKFVDFFSNGFEPQVSDSEINASGSTYLYMAFAADADTEAPALAKSFSTVAYTGNGSTNEIDGLGFSPSFVWLKDRDSTNWHTLFDTVRGPAARIHSNSTNAQDTTATNSLTSFDSDGFTLGSNANENTNGNDYIAWTWKADDNEPTIFGGDAVSVYKFEDNANDVAGNYNGTASSVSYVTGKFGKAADFNGTNSTFTFSNSIYDHNSDHSISFWLNPDTYASDEMIYWGEDDNIRWNSNGTILYKRYSNAAGNRSCNSTTVLSAGTWYHIVSTYSTQTGMALYVNGELEATHSGTQNADATSGDYGIMHRVDNNSYHSDGQVDQLRIYKGVLSDEGVKELFAEGTSDNDDLTLGGPPETIISANANAGFSIVKFEGKGNVQKIPHGLSSAPEMILFKNLDSTGDWQVYHVSVGNDKKVVLNSNSAASNTSRFDSTTPTATSFTFNTSSYTGDIIAYCWHSVSGYSAFGFWQGGTTTINIGFRADFVLYQDFGAGGSWILVDSVRGDDRSLYGQTNAAESSHTLLDITDTGFTVTSESNVVKRLYMAFKIN